MMSNRRLDLAESLLAKAKSSPFDGERESFAAGAYSQLAAYLGSGRGGGRGGADERRPTLVVPPAPIAELPGPSGSAEPPAGEEAGGIADDPDTAVRSDDLDEDTEGSGDDAGMPLVIDLRAAERAYRGAGAGRARPGALIDLTI